MLLQKSKRRGKELLLRPVHPNAGLEAAYRRRLTALVDEMAKSLLHWIGAAYRANEPAIAADETPAAALRSTIRRLSRQWLRRFDQAADDLAKWFATSAASRSDAALRSILKKGGFTVEFKMTTAARDILQATIAQNVALIKSIPEQYLTSVEGAVMRSVTAGRDLAELTKELQHAHGVSRRRAAHIALDQNNKASAAIARVRQVELGITEAIWVHSGGGKHPRPTHVKAGRERTRYDVKEGWFDPAVKKFIFPGTEPYCRCVSRAVVPGFS